MQQTGMASEAYLEAFMSGFEFVLLAIRGRLAEPGVPAAERARLESFLADYWRISAAYHERHPAPGQGLGIGGPFRAELPSVAAN
jgi:hypothetical protein